MHFCGLKSQNVLTKGTKSNYHLTAIVIQNKAYPIIVVLKKLSIYRKCTCRLKKSAFSDTYMSLYTCQQCYGVDNIRNLADQLKAWLHDLHAPSSISYQRKKGQHLLKPYKFTRKSHRVF